MNLESATALQRERVEEILRTPDEDIRLNRRIKSIPPVAPADANRGYSVMVLDTETSGVDHEKDVVIEIGYVVVRVCDRTGQLLGMVREVSMLQDPGFTLDPENVEVHGITDEDLAGKRFDLDVLTNDVRMADLVVAHNSGFDRKMIEVVLPEFAKKPWACSIEDIGWKKRGFKSNALEVIAAQSGYFYAAHRAVVDCHATAFLVSHHNLFDLIIQGAQKSVYCLAAQGSPFNKKDVLKARGYRPLYRGSKFICWYTLVDGEQVADEKTWLIDEAGCTHVPVKEIPPTDRFSVREKL